MLKNHILQLFAADDAPGGPGAIGEAFMKSLPDLSPAPPEPPTAPPQPANEPPKPPPPTEPPPEPPPAPGGETVTQPPDKPLDENKVPRTSADWDRWKAGRKASEDALRKEITARETKVSELNTRLADLEKKALDAGKLTPEMQSEFDRLKKENEEYSTRLQVTEVTAHPKFQSYFQSKVDAQLGLAKRIVGQEKATEVERILKLPEGEYRDSQMETLLAELSPVQQTRVGGVLNELDRIGEERGQAIASAAKLREQALAEQQAALTKRQRDMDATFQSVIAARQDPKGEHGSILFQAKDGDNEWNASVKARVDRARNLLFGQNVTPQDVARAAVDAVVLPDVLKDYARYKGEAEALITKLTEQVKALSAAQPGPGHGKPATSGATKEEIKPGMGSEAIAKRFVDSLPMWGQ